MDEKENAGAAPTATTGDKNIKFYDPEMITHTSTTMPLPCDSESQRQRILNYLRNVGPLSTIDARAILDVLMPATRIFELRKLGHNIVTHWRMIHTPLGCHRVAEYVLLTGGGMHE